MASILSEYSFMLMNGVVCFSVKEHFLSETMIHNVFDIGVVNSFHLSSPPRTAASGHQKRQKSINTPPMVLV